MFVIYCEFWAKQFIPYNLNHYTLIFDENDVDKIVTETFSFYLFIVFIYYYYNVNGFPTWTCQFHNKSYKSFGTPNNNSQRIPYHLLFVKHDFDSLMFRHHQQKKFKAVTNFSTLRKCVRQCQKNFNISKSFIKNFTHVLPFYPEYNSVSTIRIFDLKCFQVQSI